MIAIEVEDISKQYRIYKSDLAADRVATVLRKMFTPWRQSREGFAALRGITFQVERGDTFGIIGKNGSGKSTMLKLLARVTRADTGRIRVDGRIGPLIEVGAGFHPELTGAENVFVNGSIMGMTRKEIRARFDEIVAFSELEKFISTPVKRYSSGMYVRLGFSVAVHSSPDILLVDEVLSVGDAAFQAKSLEKIRSLCRGGTTVVFVSHNLPQVRELCARTLVLHKGEGVFLGETQAALDAYARL